jgi:hypothetical protein
MVDLSGFPSDHGWVPHRPATWKYKYASLREAGEMHHFTGDWEGGKPKMRIVPLPPGSRVRIVMVSRMGDVGITDDLNSPQGYGMRVRLDQLTDFSETP